MLKRAGVSNRPFLFSSPPSAAEPPAARTLIEKNRQCLAKRSDAFYCFSESQTPQFVLTRAKARPGALSAKDKE
jgi:hypothetical protein